MTSIPNNGVAGNNSTTSPPPRELRSVNLDGPLGLAIEIDGERVHLRPIDLRDEQQQVELEQRIAAAQSLEVDLQNLVVWDDYDRQTALRFAAEVAEQSNVRFRAGESVAQDDLFAVVLSLIPDVADVERCGRAVAAAVESAALLHPRNLQIACTNIAEQARQHGVREIRVSQLARQARDFLGQTGHVEQSSNAERRIRDVWPDAPCSENDVIPMNWRCDDAGISIAGDNILIPTQIVITRRFIEVGGQTESVELAWRRGDQWVRRIAERSTIAQRNRLTDLAAFGLPVTSGNAPDLVDFLLDYDTVNYENIPESRVSRRTGWMGTNGNLGFLWGQHLLNGLGVRDADLGGSCRVESGDQAVVFQGADTGDEQLVAGLHSQGDFTAWVQTICSLRPFPKAMLAVYASFVPPLLTLVRGANNFVMSFAGPTSVGKTTCLRLAASAWGNPDERSPEGFLKNMNATRVGIERSMATLDCLPVFVDDTKQVRWNSDIGRIVYDVVGGRGAARGSERGLAAAGTWHTVLFTTGEEPLGSFTNDGGARARIIEVWASPFGAVSAANSQVIIRATEDVLQHYGHAGPRFVNYLIRNRSSWEELQERFRVLRSYYHELAGNNSVADRMGANFAVIQLAAEFVHAALELPWQYEDTVAALWEELTAENEEADRATLAMEYLLSECQSRQQDFEDQGHDDRIAGGSMGRWRVQSDDGEEGMLAIYPPKVEQILLAGNFEPAAVKRTWRDRGWTLTSDRKLTRKVRIRVGGQSTTREMIAIRWSIIDELTDDGEGIARPPRPRRSPLDADSSAGGNMGRGREQGREHT